MAPWRRDRRKAVFAGGIMAATTLGSWWISGGQWFFALLAIVVLWGSLGSFFVTSRFTIDNAGVAVDSPFLKRRRKWTEIRTWYVDAHGATLSPFVGKSWLESYRSVRLLFGEHEDEVRKALNERLGEPAATRPGS